MLCSCSVSCPSLLLFQGILNLSHLFTLVCAGIAALEHMGSQSLQTSCMLMNLLGDSRYILFHATCAYVPLFSFCTQGTTVCILSGMSLLLSNISDITFPRHLHLNFEKSLHSVNRIPEPVN
jgi:hypothetical protein